MVVLATQLVHPDPNCPLAKTTEDSVTSMGGTLEQLVGGVWQPLGFFSKKFKSNEIQWSTFKRELYSIQQGIRHFITEVDGRHLSVFTDHAPIIHALKNTESMKHDPIARNQLVEICNWTSDICFISGRHDVKTTW